MFGKAITKGLEQGLKSLRQFVYKHYLPRTYRFHSSPPTDLNSYFSVAPEQWHKAQQQQYSFMNYTYLGLFVVGFYVADYLYSLHYNSKQSYRLYLYYPKYTNSIQSLAGHEQVRPWLEIANTLWVKDFVEFRAFWDRVGRQLRDQKRKDQQAATDAKAGRLKQEYAQFNKKYPMPNKEEAESLY